MIQKFLKREVVKKKGWHNFEPEFKKTPSNKPQKMDSLDSSCDLDLINEAMRIKDKFTDEPYRYF